MKRFLKYVFIAPLAFCLAACSFLDLEPKILAPETFYKTESEVKYGLAGVYGALNNEEIYGNFYSLMVSGIDDLTYCNRIVTTSSLYVYNFGTTDSDLYRCWTRIYAGIKNANEFMSAMESVREELDPDLRNYSEARFLRAYYHFMLAQAWGNVPLRTYASKTPDDVQLASTPQAEVLEWCTKEMEECLPNLEEGLDVAPYRITRSAVQGILARAYLFMAGATVKGLDSEAMYDKAAHWAWQVIDSGLHQLNPVYSDIFTNMMSDKYDTAYRESIWEADFYGDRTTTDRWSNGRIGEMMGMQNTAATTNFSEWNCNYAYGYYNGSLKLWDLYWAEDRTEDEFQVMNRIVDTRQEWNMAPYNYRGDATRGYVGGIDKTPFFVNNVSSMESPTVAPGIRNCTKWRREVQYEGQMTAKSLYTTINFPILRYADVLLMYAEAQNELGLLTEQEWSLTVKAVRDRAGIETKSYGEYSSQEAMRGLIRNERGRELCFEALRKYDLIRWGTFEREMKLYTQWQTDSRWSADAMSARAAVIGTNIQPKHICLPIPATELGVNKLLRQNPLW